jgi:hypothetical protein
MFGFLHRLNLFPHFLDHELGLKFLSYVWVDMIFSLYVRMAAVSTEPGFYLLC